MQPIKRTMVSLSILVIAGDVPSSAGPAVSRAAFERLVAIVRDGHSVALVGCGAQASEPDALALEALGIDVHRADPVRARARGIPVIEEEPDLDVEGLLARGRFDLALVASGDLADQYAPLLNAHSPSTRVVRDAFAGVDPMGVPADLPQLFVADDEDLAPLLDGYVRAHASDDPVSLLLRGPADDQAQASFFAAVAAMLGDLGHDLATVPDITIVNGALPLPSRTTPVRADHRWHESPNTAGARRSAARRRPRAALLVRLPDDDAAATAQLDAIAAAALPDDVRVVLASSGAAPGREQLLSGASGAEVLHADAPIGRRSAIARACGRSGAEVVVVVDPLVHPQPGFLEPLLDAIEHGAALAGAIVGGTYGLRRGEDGSLWPRAADDPGRPDALPFDVVAARSEVWNAAPADFLAREGHAETQFADWIGPYGPLVVARASRAARAGGPSASVIIATRNRVDELSGNVELLIANGIGHRGSEVLIVDNGSTDGTAELAAALAAQHPGVVRWVSEERAGLSHARNAGARAARHDLLLYIDDDARVAPGWLERMTHALAQDGVVNAGGPICALWPPERDRAWPPARLENYLSVLSYGDADRVIAPPTVVYGANWAVRRSALDAVGGFDPEFGPSAGVSINGDETSVAWRLHRAGLGHTRYVAGAAVGHRIAPDRLSDTFLVERAATNGVEQVRLSVSLDGHDRGALLRRAQGAANRLAALAPLGGPLDGAEALTAIDGLPTSVPHRVAAATALGELAAAVVLLGETQVTVGHLGLTLDPSVLRGMRCRPLVRG
jgi:GT2 family glycosyltransferase